MATDNKSIIFKLIEDARYSGKNPKLNNALLPTAKIELEKMKEKEISLSNEREAITEILDRLGTRIYHLQQMIEKSK